MVLGYLFEIGVLNIIETDIEDFLQWVYCGELWVLAFVHDKYFVSTDEGKFGFVLLNDAIKFGLNNGIEPGEAGQILLLK